MKTGIASPFGLAMTTFFWRYELRLGTLKRSFNVFSMLLYAKIFRKRIPVRIAFQLTTKCNMRCTYCYANFDTYKHLKDLTKEQIFGLFDEFYSKGCRWIWFLGGEPMVRKDFGEIIDYAQKKGMFCDMNSNGVLINENNIDIVKKLDAVCVSVDGNEESNDFYRGQGSFKKEIEAIKLLRKHGVKVRLHSILTRKSYKGLDDMVKMAKELDVTFNYCEVLRENREEDHYLTPEQHKEFYDKYLAYKKQGAPIIHSVKTIEYMMKWPKKEGDLIYTEEKDKYNKKDYVKCVSGDLQMFFDVDGRMYACNGTWENGLSYFDVGFDKAWDYLKERKCVSCKCIGMVELHTLLDLHVNSIFSGIKNILRLQR